MSRLLLVGGGHAHLFVLEKLAGILRHPFEVILITPSRWQFYSGMVPGWMAGHYRRAQCRIDLRVLSEKAGVKLIEAAVVGMDAAERNVLLETGERICYDLISLDVGGETDTAPLESLGERLLPVKPLDRFVTGWLEYLDSADRAPIGRLVVVGGGAGGVEIALAAAHGFRRFGIKASITLVAGEQGVLPGFPLAGRNQARRALARSGIPVMSQRAQGDGQILRVGRDTELALDCAIGATGSRPFAWLADTGLALDPAGYVSVDPYHRSHSHPEVLAGGDICARFDTPLAKSGVNAVRVGPVLAHNLLALVQGGSLRSYRPRRRHLYLLSCGAPSAIAVWGPLCLWGGWAWHWKDRIDRRFIARFSSKQSKDK